MEGTTFGRYLIQKEIGRGGLGVVYRARDLRFDRPVAIKMLGGQLLTQPAAWGYVLRETQIISALSHPDICAIYDVGKEKEQPYIAMECIEGCALNMLLMPSGLAPELVAHPAIHIASALAYAHERGIIHRDIRSSNIVITNQGDVKILDFGLAKCLRPGAAKAAKGALAPPLSLIEMGRAAGAIHYMAPEVLRGERANVWTDIWSFGVLLHEMATGELPFRGKTVFDLATAIISSEPIALPKKLRPWIARVIARCLERDLARRYHCVREIMTDLPPERIAHCVDLAIEMDRIRTNPAGAAAQAASAA